MFVALEGIDGSGTTTQAQILAKSLQERGHEVTLTAQPSKGELGAIARRLLQHVEPDLASATQARTGALSAQRLALIFAADRLDHVARCIEPALLRGEVVICDRYVLSSWAYQGLDLPLDWVQRINCHAPWPDLTLLLDLEAPVAAARVKARGQTQEIYDHLSLQTRLCASYRSFVTQGVCPNLQRVPAELSVDEVAQDILDRVLGALQAR